MKDSFYWLSRNTRDGLLNAIDYGDPIIVHMMVQKVAELHPSGDPKWEHMKLTVFLRDEFSMNLLHATTVAKAVKSKFVRHPGSVATPPRWVLWSPPGSDGPRFGRFDIDGNYLPYNLEY